MLTPLPAPSFDRPPLRRAGGAGLDDLLDLHDGVDDPLGVRRGPGGVVGGPGGVGGPREGQGRGRASHPPPPAPPASRVGSRYPVAPPFPGLTAIRGLPFSTRRPARPAG